MKTITEQSNVTIHYEAVSNRTLQNTVTDLRQTNPWWGLLKTFSLLAVIALLFRVAVYTENIGGLVLLGVAIGIPYAALMVTTHDAIHHTLTGWRWFDEIFPRLISYQIIWIHGVYSELHKLHHKMSGVDLRDPERFQWSEDEYAQAGALARFYVRHQWFFNIFVFSGYGLVVRTLYAALPFYGRSKAIRQQLWLDLTGIIVTRAVVFWLASSYDVVGKLTVIGLVTERIVGGIAQWRGHIEHYGLWSNGRNFLETQVFNSRNLRTNWFTSWYFNRLNYHSVHHVFPNVPFYHLKTAHKRLAAIYGTGRAGLVQDDGYIATSLRLARHPTVIGSAAVQGGRPGELQMVEI